MKQGVFFFFSVFLFALSWAQNKVNYDIENGIELIEQQYINS
jgi:hypothetical protein